METTQTKTSTKKLVVGGAVQIKIGTDYINGVIKNIDKSQENQLFGTNKSVEIKLDNGNIVWAYADDVIPTMRMKHVKCLFCSKKIEVVQPCSDEYIFPSSIKKHINVQCVFCTHIFNIDVHVNGKTNIIKVL
jgi:hypothetical protein